MALSKVKTEKKVNKTLYAILTILLGCVGINKFYAKKIKAGIISLLFCWTLVPLILSIVEFITVLTIEADKEGKISVNNERIRKTRFAASLVLFVIFIVGSIIPWGSLIPKFTFFGDLNKTLSNFKIFGYKIFNNIIGAPMIASDYSSTGVISEFGSWKMIDVSIVLVLLSLVIALVSNIKFDDLFATSNDKIKKILPIAVTTIIVSLVLVFVVTSGLDITIPKAILSISSGFNAATTVLSSALGSVLVSDFYYYISRVGMVYTSVITDSNYYGVMAFIAQSIFYTIMIISPTSVGLVIGLYYLNIPYDKWLKYIWKLLLAVLAIVIIAAIVIYILI